MKKRKKEKERMEEKEECVICGHETKYLKSTPINQRKYYVEGTGQLCRGCYGKIYYHNKYY